MSNVKIDIWEGRNKEIKRKLIQEASKTISDVLEIPIKHIRIVINEFSKDNWGFNGEQASELKPNKS